MAEREATIASRVGLHARPASIFAEAAGDLPVEALDSLVKILETDHDAE